MSIVYTCKRCGEAMTHENLEERGGHVKCIFCGYRILIKTRPPVVKRVDAK